MKARGGLHDWTRPAESVRAFIAPFAREVGVEKARTVFSVAVNFRSDCFSRISREART
jgi:hypothetical protein